MDVSDRVVGKTLLVSAAGLFLLLVTWINTYPFVDEDTIISTYIPNPKRFLLCSAAWGLLFIGGLMSFTLYHVYPHL